jgi:hypothetical protein
MYEAKPHVLKNRKGARVSKERLVLVAGDLALFKLIYEYRLLRRGHLSVLTGRPLKRLHRRLLKLVNVGYLTTIKLPQQRHIYGLGRLAAPVLVDEGIADEELLAQRSRIHELKELFLKHEMMIVDLHVTLSLATRDNALRLVDWREGRELHDSVVVKDHGVNKSLPVRPDAFFTLEDSRRPPGENKAHYFLEADRSTENQSRFRDKIRAYFHYIEEGLHNKKFGIKHFRVLTIATTEERAKNLAAMTRELLPEYGWKYFFFGSLKNFSIENPAPILEAVHLSPRDVERRYPLVPVPAAVAEAV